MPHLPPYLSPSLFFPLLHFFISPFSSSSSFHFVLVTVSHFSFSPQALCSGSSSTVITAVASCLLTLQAHWVLWGYGLWKVYSVSVCACIMHIIVHIKHSTADQLHNRCKLGTQICLSLYLNCHWDKCLPALSRFSELHPSFTCVAALEILTSGGM